MAKPATDATESVVLTERRDAVLIITLNRPHTRNALTPEVFLRLAGALDELKRDRSLRCAVLTGAAGTFCSGMDLKGFAGGFGVAGMSTRRLASLFRFLQVQQSPKPLIAAVEGAALAGGFELAYQCDLFVAARDARLGLPEVKRGLVAFGGILTTLPHRLPLHLANELALLGEQLSAERAYEMGIVNRVVAPGAALSVALELANGIAANAPLAVAATRRIMKESSDWSVRTAFARQLALALPVLGSKDAREGAKAFAQKRQPEWKGK